MKLATLRFAARAALSVTAFVALGGCMSSSPIWDAHFGEAEKAVTQAQIIDPRAAEHTPSVDGIDGKAAASAMTQYDKSFAQPATNTNPFVIGVSTGGSSGGSSGQ
ncbi:hypothetical protein [Paraburkholderia phenazinium]|jgi:hypothetical protein|uniref:Lipoprotein n=1 Tax=Paraburkholderia phenazinium TaxID=60549 RepID=A0A1G8HS80_9BURK|nr:hypothetical protein [Paraburkholderia phenazinium]SDI09516.1 hypothetical protein SAMN05216466_11751 [Paraburkholderia phenazinium]